MSGILLLLLASAIFIVAAIYVDKRQKKPGRIMEEGKLPVSEIV